MKIQDSDRFIVHGKASDSTFASEDADIRFVPRLERADGSSTEGVPHLLNTVDFFGFLRLPSH